MIDGVMMLLFGWCELLVVECDSLNMVVLVVYLCVEYVVGKWIFLCEVDWFCVLNLMLLVEVWVVILGQDFYYGEGQVYGFSFLVLLGVKLLLSFVNIYKEMVIDFGILLVCYGVLEYWVKQGVLLLNVVLMVEMGCVVVYKGWGWECFIDVVIWLVVVKFELVVFILWGVYVQKKVVFVEDVVYGGWYLVLKLVYFLLLFVYGGFFGSWLFF